jgi:hypothetical protein
MDRRSNVKMRSERDSIMAAPRKGTSTRIAYDPTAPPTCSMRQGRWGGPCIFGSLLRPCFFPCSTQYIR